MRNISEQKTAHIDISNDILIIESPGILLNLPLQMIKTCTPDECIFEITNETNCCLSTTLIITITHNTIIIDNPFIIRININTPISILCEYYTKKQEEHRDRIKEFEKQSIILQEQNDLIKKIKNDPSYKYIQIVNNIVKYYKNANKRIKRIKKTPEEWKEYNNSDEYKKLNILGFYSKYPKDITDISTLESAKDTFNNMKNYIKEIYETQYKDSEWLQQHKKLELLNNNLPDKTTWLYRYFGIQYIF